MGAADPSPIVEPDAELAGIRARLTQEIRARATLAAPGPTALGSASVGAFLARHERVVVDVWAPWCGPCRALAPVLDDLAKEYRGSVAFAKVNADDEPVLAGRWGVQAIPTLMLFRRGRPVDRVVGVLPREALRLRLLRALEPSDPAEERE